MESAPLLFSLNLCIRGLCSSVSDPNDTLIASQKKCAVTIVITIIALQIFRFKYDLGQKYQAPQLRPDRGLNS